MIFFIISGLGPSISGVHRGLLKAGWIGYYSFSQNGKLTRL